MECEAAPLKIHSPANNSCGSSSVQRIHWSWLVWGQCLRQTRWWHKVTSVRWAGRRNVARVAASATMAVEVMVASFITCIIHHSQRQRVIDLKVTLNASGPHDNRISTEGANFCYNWYSDRHRFVKLLDSSARTTKWTTVDWSSQLR